MKKTFLIFLLIIGMGLNSHLFSADQSPPCYRQIQLDFFREDLIVSALSSYSVLQSLWALIYQDLQVAVQYVPGLVKTYANARNPNPLDPYFIPASAAEILQQALYQVYSTVMLRYAAATNNVIDQNTINGTFRYLWEQQYNRLAACMR